MQIVDVYGLGNPIMDILVHVEDDVLQSLELVKNSMNLVDEAREEEILEKTSQHEKQYDAGGSCANTMATIAQLGGSPAYSGKIGNDDIGEKYEQSLQNAGVSVHLGKAPGRTGNSQILITPDAARTMNTFLGNCQLFSADDVQLKTIESCDILYFTGYLWDTPSQKEAVKVALNHAKQFNKRIAMSLSDSFCVNRHMDDFKDLLKNYVDMVFCNEDELNAIAGEEDWKQSLQVIGEWVDEIILTLGAEGAVIQKADTLINIPAFEVTAVDTTGAGDSFAAGYLYGITHQYTEEAAGKLASYIASRIVSQVGPRYQGDIRQLVKDFL
jgi:sugar/nucleoside kinase (ribokinase family)